MANKTPTCVVESARDVRDAYKHYEVVHFLEVIGNIVRNGQGSSSTGICGQPGLNSRLVAIIAKHWPRYSGNSAFPIPAGHRQGMLAPASLYRREWVERRLWSNPDRHDLVRFIAEVLECAATRRTPAADDRRNNIKEPAMTWY